MGITLIKYKENKNLFYFINLLIFLKKFKFIYKFNYNNNINYINKYIVLQKKANLYFKSNFFSNKLLKKKMLNFNNKKLKSKGKRRVYNTYKENLCTNNLNNKLKFFRLKENF